MEIKRSPISDNTIYTTVNGVFWDHSGDESKSDMADVTVMYTNNKDLESISFAAGDVAIQIPFESIFRLVDFWDKECKK